MDEEVSCSFVPPAATIRSWRLRWLACYISADIVSKIYVSKY